MTTKLSSNRDSLLRWSLKSLMFTMCLGFGVYQILSGAAFLKSYGKEAFEYHMRRLHE